MENINWIIIQSNNRESNYGVGTSVRSFTEELLKRQGISVCVLKLDSES